MSIRLLMSFRGANALSEIRLKACYFKETILLEVICCFQVLANNHLKKWLIWKHGNNSRQGDLLPAYFVLFYRKG